MSVSETRYRREDCLPARLTCFEHAVVPLFWAGTLIAWSTFIQPLIATRESTSRWHPARYPLLINIFFLALPTVFTVVLIYYSIIANRIFSSIFSLYLTLDAGLAKAISSIESGQPADIASLLALQATGVKLIELQTGLIAVWHRLWIISATLILVITLVSIPASQQSPTK